MFISEELLNVKKHMIKLTQIVPFLASILVGYLIGVFESNAEATYNNLPYLLGTIVFPMIVGIFLGLEDAIKEWRREGKLRFNYIMFLLFTVIPLLGVINYYFIGLKIIPGLHELFGSIYFNWTIMIISGFYFIRSFYKEKE